MSGWDAALYLRFQQERTQPARDLAARVQSLKPARAADIGCGPGNSTAVLAKVFPNAHILGIDSSENMIAKAQKEHPELTFRCCDARELENGYDLLFSNACLQWLPDHERLIPQLMGKLSPGGCLAVQIPMNTEEPFFRLMVEVLSEPRWNSLQPSNEANATLEPAQYHAILSDCASDFSIWEVKYYHLLPDHKALVDWVRGTRLRPYLSQLDEQEQKELTAELEARAKPLYPIQKNGGVLLGFRRFFFTAMK